jgi:glycerophosphoryl diester phosphodiesterase
VTVTSVQSSSILTSSSTHMGHRLPPDVSHGLKLDEKGEVVAGDDNTGGIFENSSYEDVLTESAGILRSNTINSNSKLDNSKLDNLNSNSPIQNYFGFDFEEGKRALLVARPEGGATDSKLGNLPEESTVKPEPTVANNPIPTPPQIPTSKIPLLSSVFNICTTYNLKMNIEIKQKGYVKEVLDLVRKYDPRLEGSRVSSFNRDVLIEVQELDPEMPIGVLFNGGNVVKDANNPEDKAKWKVIR